MAKRITTLSNRFKTRPNNRLDSDRYRYLDITQAEPNPGNPESDGMVLSSTTTGVRSWTNDLLLSRLRFQVGALDSAGPNDLYLLTVKGNPFDGIIDSIGVKSISDFAIGAGDSEQDTLDTVTGRGNTTLNDITIGALTADSATFNYNVIIQGNLTVNGTTTTLNTQDLIVEDKNVILAYGAPNALAADSAGITIQGANATILYNYAADAWKFNKKIIIDSNLDVLGSGYFSSNVNIDGSLTASITSLDSTTINDTLKLLNVPVASTQYGLFIESDGTVTQKLVESPVFSGIASRVTIQQKNDSVTYYPLFVNSTSGDDSVNIDLNLTYNALQNRLTLGNLTLSQILEQATAPFILTKDSAGIVGFKNINDLLLVQDSEQDTLDTVTDRGNTTTNAITVGNLTADITNLDSTTVAGDLKFTKRLRDNSNRALLIYDSTGAVLWGA
jgi:hypothetical protein